jgi:fumarate reductase subunit D
MKSTGTGAGAPPLKRSHEPVFWALFGAGGMMLALLGPVLVLATGLAVPLGWLPADTLSPTRVLAFAQHPLGKLALLGLVSLSLFHACHRLRHSLHDLGWSLGTAGAVVFYGFAAAGSGAAAVLLWRIGLAGA